MHAFLAQSRFTPGLIEIFQSLVATEDQSMKQRGGNARDMGAGSTLMKLFVPQKYIGKPFDELFEGLLREQGAVALALYRATHREDNDNVLPYVYTCPQRETTLNESDGVLVLMPPKQSGNVLTSSDDEERSAHVYVPSFTIHAIILFLSGFDEPGIAMCSRVNISLWAEKLGFIAVCPNALGERLTLAEHSDVITALQRGHNHSNTTGMYWRSFASGGSTLSS